ncbi:MAG: heavy metal-binding domain-containing protein, partial [Deltaproteobacteria bacterium]|nr:heavy metal-binding domain-containing protein [Deltaproteobacteria bacterium]
MKTKIMLFGFLALFVAGGFFVSCKKEAPTGESGQKISYYTCPMHPQIHEDHPGECPICHMKLVPVYQSSGGGNSSQGEGEKGVTISAERQQLIGVKIAPVVRKNLIRIIRTSGRRVPTGEAAVDAPLYAEDLALIKPGMAGKLRAMSGGEFDGLVSEIFTDIDPVTHFGRVRIQVAGPANQLPHEPFFSVEMEAPLGEKLSVPKSAVLETGTRRVVFIKHEPSHFAVREIRTGESTEEDYEVLEGLEAGENVVTQAAFLIDSESQL